MKKCLFCGAEFSPKNPKGKFCSNKHKVYWHRESKKPLPKPPKIDDNVDWYTKMKAKEKMPKTLDELKALCPKELTGFERSEWIATERQKYNI